MESFAAIADSSQQYITWALALFGGSIATVVGTSHISPDSKWGRASYLLFIPAWASLCVSVWYGDLVSRNYLASLTSKAPSAEILRAMNANLIDQQDWMLWAVGSMALWLAFYVLWWVFRRPANS